MKKSAWWSVIPHNLSLPLILIIGYLFLVAIGNLLALYQHVVVQPNLINAFGYFFSMLLYAIPGYGLLKLKRWARLMELFLSSLSVILGFILMFSGAMGMGVLVIVPHGLIAIYLLTDKCRELFGFVEKKAS